MAARDGAVAFEDFFPVMVERLGARGFMEELSKGFRLLMDEEKRVITLKSLKRKASLLGLQAMTDEDARSMVREGDLDGDGTLDEKEFCVLMFRLSPGLMKGSKEMLEEAIDSS
ncbi:calcium-binding protein PBP1-like [Syzygium oleosum]|uniref:calcium-binding protein PBP1-like n=1 Tax=Syzygium oleosum TaxID=219896 RepID=UPI0024BBDCD7|nr:calcium-binding protein PBP1-like [Syzygium oleosum]